MKILAAVSQSYGAGSSASMSAPLGSYVTRGYSRDVEQVKMSRQMHDNRNDSRGSGDARGRRSQLVHAEVRGVEIQCNITLLNNPKNII